MRYILFILFLTIANSLSAQSYEKYKDERIDMMVYKGEITFDDLEQEPDFKWFRKGVKRYRTDKKAIDFLSKYLPDYKVVTLLGTWCSDSHDLVPKLYKVLQESNYPMAKAEVIALDADKHGLKTEDTDYNVEFVPTIIIYKDGKEVTRIIEQVTNGIENELVSIIAKDKR